MKMCFFYKYCKIIIVGQGPIALAVVPGGGCLDVFFSLYPFSPLTPSLWETARYRLKYSLKGPLNPKQPTNCKIIYNSNGDKYTGKAVQTTMIILFPLILAFRILCKPEICEGYLQ